MIDSPIQFWLNEQTKLYTLIQIDESQNQYFLSSLDDLTSNFDKFFGYECQWYICSGNLDRFSAAQLPELPVVTIKQFPLISLDKIDFTLQYFADNYQWSILPWGRGPRCSSFVFISKDASLRDQFIEISNNPSKVEDQKTSSCNKILISIYDVFSKFSEVAKALLFQEDIDTIGETWDAFKCDINPPYLISDILFNEETLLITSTGDIDKDIKFTKINHPISIDLLEAYGLVVNLYIYRPNNKRTFEALSELIYGLDTHLFVWIDGHTNLNLITDLISKIYLSNSDLTHLSDILKCTQWMYGLRRDVFEIFTSIIICNNNTILQEIDAFRSDSYHLLGCF
ncbi:MAG TPA: hypothetical protein V6D15_11720 [Oculatellaceae cyanobacterium]